MRFSSLKLLGTVGEPINPEAWNWYHDVVGKGECPIVDTWWQTETGGHLSDPVARCDAPQSQARRPIRSFGVQPVILEPTTGQS